MDTPSEVEKEITKKVLEMYKRWKESYRHRKETFEEWLELN